MPETETPPAAETEAGTETPPSPPIETPPAAETDANAEVEKWKALARKNEDKAKANAAAAKKLEEIQAAQMSETEKAVNAARAEGKAEATSANAQKLAAAEIKAALTGVVPDPSGVVEDLNLAKYISEDGEVDADAVAKLREKYAAFAAPGTPPVPGVPLGPRPTDPGVKQLTRADLKTMSAAEIVAANKAGQLNDIRATG